MKRIVSTTIAIALLALSAAAQEAQPAPAKEPVTKVFPIRYQDPALLPPVLAVFGVTYQISKELKVIAVTGPAERVAAVEDALKRLDVPAPPPKNVELTFYIVAAQRQAAQAETIPPELEPVTKQLSKLFSYQGFRVQDTMILRVRDGKKGEASGAGPSPIESQPAIYQVAVYSASITPDPKGNLVRIDDLRFGARIPYPTGPGQFSFRETGFNTNLDVREGQKVVVGKANVDSASNAMILVVTAKVVE